MPLTGHVPGLLGAPRGVRHMSQIGPIARSVEDLITALPLIAGPDGERWEVPPVPMLPALASCLTRSGDRFHRRAMSDVVRSVAGSRIPDHRPATRARGLGR